MDKVNSLTKKYPSASIWVTGHSLGGAIANLAAVEIKQTFGKEITLYTFEAPRVGNKYFAKFFN